MELKPFGEFLDSKQIESFAESISQHASDEVLKSLEKTQNANMAILNACVNTSVKITMDALKEYHDWLSHQLSE